MHAVKHFYHNKFLSPHGRFLAKGGERCVGTQLNASSVAMVTGDGRQQRVVTRSRVLPSSFTRPVSFHFSIFGANRKHIGVERGILASRSSHFWLPLITFDFFSPPAPLPFPVPGETVQMASPPPPSQFPRMQCTIKGW
ncbi:hypothetical protein CDAR_208771 [Caerostris darwini]|uniref:Uncharacterized protein n=1 Tax=Caerostris darwini TaxID=1538125 RepID=A0AAV4VQJ5_9ARAC|nr:hypothetical protein CDAR_208771 [Caerostris darwini]